MWLNDRAKLPGARRRKQSSQSVRLLADEVGDVLLCLIRVTDHIRVDLERSVGRKLLKNANEDPPLHNDLPAGARWASTR